MEKRFERTYMKICVVSPRNLSKEEALKKANHERFAYNPFMVGDMSRVEDLQTKSGMYVFTITEIYHINSLFSKKYIRHLFCKLRAAALRYMGISPIVVIVIDECGLTLVNGATEIG